MDFGHIWYDDRYSSSFIQQYPSHAYDLKVKVTDLKILYLSFLRAHIFQTIRWILFVFGLMIDTGPKLYSAILPAHVHGLKVKVNNLEILH